MVLPGPPGGRVRRRRPTFGPTPASTLVEAGVGLFVRPGFYRTFHAETQRKPRGRRGNERTAVDVLSVPLRLCVKRSVRAIAAARDYGVRDAGAAYSPHDTGRCVPQLSRSNTH